MGLSKITLEFSKDFGEDDKATFSVNYNGHGSTIGERGARLRKKNGQTTVGYMRSSEPEQDFKARMFVLAFNIDYNFLYLYTVVRDKNKVTITARKKGTTFGVGYNNTKNVILSIDNDLAEGFRIIDVSYSEAKNPCTHVSVKVTTSTFPDEIKSPISKHPVENPIIFEYQRGVSAVVEVLRYSTKEEYKKNIKLPPILTSELLNIDVFNTPTGATVTANINLFSLELEYSIDDVNWSVSNIFSGQFNGDYTLYARDQYGCKIQKNYNVSGVDVGFRTSYVSKANSISFAKRENKGCYILHNDENTLSCEARTGIKYKTVQLFTDCDTVKTQLKTNHDIIKAKIVHNGIDIDLPISRVTDNIGLKDLRDARKYKISDDKFGIYFISGNIYDYDDNSDTGNDYLLNGALPAFAKIGGYVRINMVWYQIESIIFDPKKNSEVLVIKGNHTGVEVVVKCGAIYNLDEYNVFEFSIFMANYINSDIKVFLNFGNVDFYESELIRVRKSFDNTVKIEYSNSDNTDIYYNSGIDFLMRIPYKSIIGKVGDDNEVHKTDTSAYLLSQELIELDEYTFEPVDKEIMRKLSIALSCDNLKIDGVNSVKNSSISTEVQGDTNLYVVVSEMIKIGSNELTKGRLVEDVSWDLVPLIDSTNGYVIF